MILSFSSDLVFVWNNSRCFSTKLETEINFVLYPCLCRNFSKINLNSTPSVSEASTSTSPIPSTFVFPQSVWLTAVSSFWSFLHIVLSNVMLSVLPESITKLVFEISNGIPAQKLDDKTLYGLLGDVYLLNLYILHIALSSLWQLAVQCPGLLHTIQNLELLELLDSKKVFLGCDLKGEYQIDGKTSLLTLQIVGPTPHHLSVGRSPTRWWDFSSYPQISLQDWSSAPQNVRSVVQDRSITIRLWKLLTSMNKRVISSCTLMK